MQDLFADMYRFMKLGMQGVSVVLASGDSGVAGPAGDDNTDGCLGTGQIFSPDFPATCPYITTVGATFLPQGGNVYEDQETAVTRFGSGGGMSQELSLDRKPSLIVSRFLEHLPNPIIPIRRSIKLPHQPRTSLHVLQYH